MEKYQQDMSAQTAKKERKKQEEMEQKAMQEMFKVAVKAPVLEPGVDPKSVLCPWFKAKQCARGDKCKYSHDHNVGRKGAKLDIYQDRRDTKKEDTSENWDQATLENAVKQKQKKGQAQCDIICKYFIEAVQDRRYGWFWECPNGETCHYKHALPPGFVLEPKKRGGQEEDEEEETPLEEILEAERAALGGQGTPVTLERFQEWKKTRTARQKQVDDAAKAKREREVAAGKAQNLTGRELLKFRPELFNDTEDPGTADFDYTALRKELMADEDAAAEASVVNYQDATRYMDMEIDESLFADEPLPEDDDDEEEAAAEKTEGAAEDVNNSSNSNNNNNNDSEKKEEVKK
jgi:hypothetical protein